MAVVIRVLYNNQGWKAHCIKPYTDRLCSACFKENVNVSIRPPSRNDEVCTGGCWERSLCVDYHWGCTPAGRRFGKRAYPGIKVFFVFKQPDGNYTLWGTSTVRSIDEDIIISPIDNKGYAFIHFHPFEQLPPEKWLSNLTAKQLVGKEWRQGRFRYIDNRQESILEQFLMRGVSSLGDHMDNKTNDNGSSFPKLAPGIEKKLDTIADYEGRSKDDLVREAVAEWLNKRDFKSNKG